MQLAALIALGAAFLPAAPTSPYTVAATRSCLMRLPAAVAGLPPASPPVPPALFVRVLPERQLGIWTGRRAYRGIVLRFFTSARAAHSVSADLRIRNVVATRDEQPGPALRRTVLGCLRSHALPVVPRSAPPASLATFAGFWGGHTRGLSIDATGRGEESTDDGCCRRSYRLRLQVLSVRGTLTNATAVYRVLSFTRHERSVPVLHAGQLGRLVLRNGILTNRLTRVYFCSDPAWGATGACGA